MTRGTDANLAYVFTTPARPADPQPGTRPAPELGRYERLRRERAGYLPDEPSPVSTDRTGQREPIAVLAIWTAETQAARHDRYRDLAMAALPPGHRQPLSHQARWLYRTLHAAELAGLDPAEVIRTAIAARVLPGAEDADEGVTDGADVKAPPGVFPGGAFIVWVSPLSAWCRCAHSSRSSLTAVRVAVSSTIAFFAANVATSDCRARLLTARG